MFDVLKPKMKEESQSMPKEIKTKTTVRDIKVFDRAADVSTHMKNALIKAKAAAESPPSSLHTPEADHRSPSEYATDTVSDRAKDIAQEAAHGAKNKLSHPYQKAKDNAAKAKEHFQDAKNQLPKRRAKSAEQSKDGIEKANQAVDQSVNKAKESRKAAEQTKQTAQKTQKTTKDLKGNADGARQTAEKAKQTADQLGSKAKDAQKTTEQAKKAVKDAKQTLLKTRQTGRQTVKTAKKSVKNVKPAQKTIKTSAKTIKTTEKNSIKAAKHSVKTAERSGRAAAKAAVKTARQAAKAAQKSAQAAKKTTKTAVKTARATVKATVTTVKAAISATKGLVSLIAAGGWVAVVVIIIICLIALLVGSVFGIFFSGEDSGTGRSMPAVVSELTAEFYGGIDIIKNQHVYDVLDVDAMAIDWTQVLAVYAVKLNTDSGSATEVVTLDDKKVDKLHNILHDMASMSYYLKTEKHERTVTVTDDEGNNTRNITRNLRTVFLRDVLI